MKRRDFMRSLGAFVIASSFCSCRSLLGRGGYDVVILGDTHYDAEPADVYHSHYDEKVEWLNRVQRAEFARNGEMWRERCPRLLKRAAANVTDATAFSLQTGDLIQGDCGDAAVHARMLDDVMNCFKRELGGLPFVTVCGNHDIRATGAAKAYADYMPKRMSRELGRCVEGVNFMFEQGEDAWIVVDFNSTDARRIDRLLDAAVDARRLFFAVHAPVIPSDNGSARWMFFGGADENATALRRHFRRRLAERNAIVLAGHTHRQELMDWAGDGGRITQFVANSVWSDPQLATATVESEGAANYGELQMRREVNANGRPAPGESALFGEYRPGLMRYFRERAAGSYLLSISDNAVSIACYAGDSSVALNVRLR